MLQIFHDCVVDTAVVYLKNNSKQALKVLARDILCDMIQNEGMSFISKIIIWDELQLFLNSPVLKILAFITIYSTWSND